MLPWTFLLLLVATAFPKAEGQVCQPGRTSNGCSNARGNAFFLAATTGTNKCFIPAASTCAAGTVPLGPNDITGGIATLGFCSGLQCNALAAPDAGGLIKLTLNAVLDATNGWIPIAGGPALVPQPGLSGCTAGQFFGITINTATAAVTASCLGAVNTLLCGTPVSAAPVIDVAYGCWSEWTACKMVAGVACGGTSSRTRMRLCNNPAVASGAGAATICPISAGNVATTQPGVVGEINTDATCTVTCQIGLCFGGYAYNSYNVLKNVDAIVPGQTCTTNNIPAMPFGLRNPVVGLIGGSLTVCGRTYPTWQCFSLANTNGAVWTPAGSSMFYHYNIQGTFDAARGRLYLCDDTDPEYFGAAGWKTNNAFPPTTFRMGAGVGCIVYQNYLYFFGGKVDYTNAGAVYVQRYNLLAGGAGTWEVLLTNFPQTVSYPTVVFNPTYRNQFFIFSQTNAQTYYTYDIYTNTLTANNIAPPAIGQIDGADYGEMCADTQLYARGGGLNLFTPITQATQLLVGGGSWTAINGVNSVGRVYDTCLLVQQSAINFLVSGCVGC